MAKRDLTLPFCSIVAMDSSNFCYRVCSNCEGILPDKSNGFSEFQHCSRCSFNQRTPASKRVYKLLLSVATDKRVMIVICFDKPAKVLMGCSADELFDFSCANPFALEASARFLEGQMFQMVLRKPQSGNAQHMRIDSIVPLASNFHPVIEYLKKLYRT
ncbi:hypothetical protein SUGI_0042270 [Cryptomeria japonica]|uniref:uncharacterized protein LOC131049700 n=1 Tax=Cryptomeria japonica TaxID=3369 RepID=UPI002408934A|nr:uncharacterized protein LOC131049700 [Cryptomeria japonica]GLJ06572.1 hypothetical protein SUGI_0042270 [Cryptomeria japonica]